MGDFNCEFNAPMFVDFENMDDHNDHAAAEAYFEVNHEEIPTDSGAEAAKKAPANVVTSWEEVFKKKQNAAPEPKSGLNSSFKDTPTRRALRQAVTDTIKDITNSPKLEIPEKRTRSPVKRLQGGPRAVNAGATPSKSPAMARWRKAIKMMTPDVLKNARTANRLKNLEQERIAPKSFKSQLATSRRLAAAKNPPAATARHLKPEEPAKGKDTQKILKPTTPEPFKFATDARIKTGTGPVSTEGSGVNFAKMLRSYQEHPANSRSQTGVCTKVQPFNLSGGGARQRGRSAEATPSRRPMAEQILRMQQGTPERFRSRHRWRSNSPGPRGRRSPSPGLTVAQSPNLMTRGRSRPAHVISQKEREEMEMEEAKKNQFKARGVNEGIKPTKYPTIERKACTKPQPFHFSHVSKKPVKHEEPSHEFHANPLNKKILQKPVGIPAVAPKSAVVPESPAFELKNRMANRKRPHEEEDTKHEGKRIFHARPVPQYGLPVVLPNNSKKVTKTAPFSFNDRDTEAQHRKEEKIKQMIEEEQKAREFKAKPVPKSISGPVNLPMKEVEEPTQAVPFSLSIEKRVEDRLKKWEKSVEEDLRKQRDAANFKAKPATILEKQPFIPHPSDKIPATAEGFSLHSDRRAAEREEFNQRMRQKEAEMEAMKKKNDLIKMKEEEARVQQMRREAVHKAQPIKHYKPVQVLPSDRPVTNPVSPHLSYKEGNRRKGSTPSLGDTFNLDN